MDYSPRTAIDALEWLEEHCPCPDTIAYFQSEPLSEMTWRMDELVLTARFLGFPN